MTVDHQNSVYVGGLPYECTESQLRRYFQPYGSVTAVKINNERTMGGRCYGFVTFTNPRSVAEAIRKMDGRILGGRVVRVNEVTTRGFGGRSNYGHDNSRHNERDKDGVREREDDHDKDRHRDHSKERDGKRERGYGRSHDRDVDHDVYHFQGKDRGQSKDTEDQERGHNRNHGWERGRDEDLVASRDKHVDDFHDDDRRGDKNLDRHTLRKNRSSSYERESREHSSESSDYYHQVEEQLHLLTQRREELQKEKSEMEQTLEEKKQLIVSLQKRSMKLEDGLTSAKRVTSKRQMQLTKLCNPFEQFKEYAERLKGLEQEIQDLVSSVSMDIDGDGDLVARGLSHANGKE